MSKLGKIAFAHMLLMGLLPEKTQAEIEREEENANRAIANGRINKHEIQKQIDEAMKPLIQSEVRKRGIVVYYTDEKGQIKRKRVLEESDE